MSGENPYMQLCALFGGESSKGGSGGLRLLRGSVTSVEPLVVQAASLQLRGDSLSINADLLSEDKDKGLNRGDRLAILTEDYQKFFSISKVVDM